MKSDKTS